PAALLGWVRAAGAGWNGLRGGGFRAGIADVLGGRAAVDSTEHLGHRIRRRPPDDLGGAVVHARGRGEPTLARVHRRQRRPGIGVVLGLEDLGLEVLVRPTRLVVRIGSWWNRHRCCGPPRFRACWAGSENTRTQPSAAPTSRS